MDLLKIIEVSEGTHNYVLNSEHHYPNEDCGHTKRIITKIEIIERECMNSSFPVIRVWLDDRPLVDIIMSNANCVVYDHG